MSDEMTVTEVSMEDAARFIKDNSTVKANGIREMGKPAFVQAMAQHGVTRDDYDRVQKAVDFQTTAASHVALEDLEAKISEGSDDDRKDDTWRRGLQATVRIPTFGGATDITLNAETRNPIPFRGEGGGEPEFKTSHGRLRTSITSKGRVHKGFHDEAKSRIRKALGVADDAD